MDGETLGDGDAAVDGEPAVDGDVVVAPRLAAGVVAFAGTSALLALAATGHGRVVTVVALGTLLVAVLDATANALAPD